MATNEANVCILDRSTIMAPCVNIPEDVKVQSGSSLSRTKTAYVNNSRQGKNDAVVGFHDHGALVDDVKKRVRCNYCGKEIDSYYLLKYHLGGMHESVVPCVKVPEDVKLQMRNSLPRTTITHVNNSGQGKNAAIVGSQDHGSFVDGVKKRVRCNYCGKEIDTYFLLKYHLGGLHEYVVPCVKVPEDVKLHMRNSLFPETKKPDEHREVLQLSESSSSWKRDSSSDDSAPDEEYRHSRSLYTS